MHDLEIEIGIHVGWAGQHLRKVSHYCKQTGRPPTELVLEKILDHEIAHEQVCPCNASYGADLRYEIAAVLVRAKRYSPEMACYVTNLIADMFVNITLGSAPDFTRGLVVAWFDQGAAPYVQGGWWQRLCAWLVRFGRAKKFQPLFEVFVLVQLPFFRGGEEGLGRLLQPYLRTRQLPATGRRPTPLAGREEKPRPQDIDWAAQEIVWLIDEKRVQLREARTWFSLAPKITKLLLPFLPENPPRQFESHPYFEYHHPDDAAREDALVKQGERIGRGDGSEGDSGARPGGNDAGIAGGDGPEDDSGGVPGGNGAGTGRGRGPLRGAVVTDGEWISPRGCRVSARNWKEALDAVYEIEAGRTELNFRTRRDLDEVTTRYLGVFEKPGDKLGESDPIRSVLFAIDCSGSMTGTLGQGRELIADTVRRNVGWTTASRYHAALLAIYGVTNWLLEQKDRYEVNVLTFSGKTRTTGWCRAGDLRDKLPEIAFSPEFGGTVLDIPTVRKQLRDDASSLVLLVSDGELSNAGEAVELFARDEIRARHVLTMIHTNSQGRSSMAKAMAAANFKVIDVPDAAALPRSIVQSALEILD